MTTRFDVAAAALLCLALAPREAAAQREAAVRQEAEALAGLPRDAFIAEIEARSERMLDAMTLLYARVDPAIAEALGPSEWSEAEREAAACVLDAHAAAGETMLLARAIAATGSVAERIETDPSLDFVALMRSEDDPFDLGGTGLSEAEQDRMTAVSQRCGMIEAQSRRFSDPRVMRLLMRAMEEHAPTE